MQRLRHTDIQTALQACEDALLELQIAVHRRHWQRLDSLVCQYQQCVHELQRNMHGMSNLPADMLNRFQHLSVQQRRIMRSIHQHMQQTQEDIRCLDQGLAKLKHATEHTPA